MEDMTTYERWSEALTDDRYDHRAEDVLRTAVQSQDPLETLELLHDYADPAEIAAIVPGCSTEQAADRRAAYDELVEECSLIPPSAEELTALAAYQLSDHSGYR